MRLEAEVNLARDPREKTKCAVVFQYVATVRMDISKVRSGNLDERCITPIQVLDVIFRQGLSCPYLP